jgi:pimeloyl-ACP methyl ester carboxylesterase
MTLRFSGAGVAHRMSHLVTMTTPNLAPLCVVLLHGAAHNSSVWKSTRDRLHEAGLAVMAPNLPGHGGTAGPALANIQTCADWVLAEAAKQGPHRLVLVGHSLGALIALEAAARAADWSTTAQPQIAGLVLLGVAYPMKVSPALLSLALEQEAQAIKKVAQYSHGPQAALAQDADHRLMQQEQNQYTAAGHGNLLHHDLSLCSGYSTGLQSAAQVRCASTLIVGEMDRMTPLAASAELQGVLGAQRIELATGHNLMAEDAAGVLAALLTVCRSLPVV